MSNKLFVRNLSWSVTEDELFDLFGEAGEVISVKIPTRPEDGKPRGFAFIEMATAEAGRTAIQRFNGMMLANRDLVVDVSDSSAGGGGRRSEGGGYGSGKSHAEPNAKLFIRNVDYSVSEDDLRSLFQQMGAVYSVRIPTDRETGQPRGFAFVEMGSPEEAQRAILELNSTVLGGKEIGIAVQDPSKAKPRTGGGYGGGRSSGGYGRERSGGGYGGGRW